MSSKQEEPENNLPPGLARPAQRALAAAGYRRLEQLAEVSEAELKQLHGIGPKALEQLRQALATEGLSFAAER
ncbi:MAG TPA: helix-hairpin-helix domain-containing protein [Anaerolineae bacterium]|nr:helix-hairpin-helix domain-containing protein [Anaerolineae bacterium]